MTLILLHSAFGALSSTKSRIAALSSALSISSSSADSSESSPSAGTYSKSLSSSLFALKLELLRSAMPSSLSWLEEGLSLAMLGYRSSWSDSSFMFDSYNNMPIKKAPQRGEGAENEKNEDVARHRMPLAYYVIMIAIVLFGINVGYETYEDMDNQFSVTDSQSKTCIIDFQKNSCNPLNLTESCEKILDCVQKDNNQPWSTKALAFMNFFLEEIQ
jgi:hypothetical protein